LPLYTLYTTFYPPSANTFLIPQSSLNVQACLHWIATGHDTGFDPIHVLRLASAGSSASSIGGPQPTLIPKRMPDEVIVHRGLRLARRSLPLILRPMKAALASERHAPLFTIRDG